MCCTHHFYIGHSIFFGRWFLRLQDRRVVDKTSELGKMRTNARTANRRSRENAKGHFIAEALIEGADG